jgi:4-hydroxy-3-methylbut-2-en-1-yl diphosphate synthase IspG/GcpE
MKLDKRQHPINQTFVCKDCVFVFTIHSTKKNYIHCPSCGDSIQVEPFVKANREKKGQRKWTDEENLLVKRIVMGELKKYQVAAVTGRTYEAVQRKVEKYRKGVEGK